MEPPPKPASTSLFQVYLRLRPALRPASPIDSIFPILQQAGRYLTVEKPCLESDDAKPTHITVTPPTETRRRAVEKFAFTRVFEEESSQLDLFRGTGAVPLLEGVLGAGIHGGRDGLLATLGVTGSGKTHTILGSKSQRGLTQLTLDVLFRSLGDRLLHPATALSLQQSLAIADASESQLFPASIFLDGYYGDALPSDSSRAATPMTVGTESSLSSPSKMAFLPSLLGLSTGTSPRGRTQQLPFFSPTRLAKKVTKLRFGAPKDAGSIFSSANRRHILSRPSNFTQVPRIDDIAISIDNNAEYAVVLSMYEVYNDRIFDLLAGNASSSGTSAKATAQRDLRRRALLFKSTEQCPNRKLVAGLTKVICGTAEEALIVLETGLTERRVAGTGSNLASSRSHGFFCIEVKKRARSPGAGWSGSTMSIVDLAGSERARDAKTAGATLAEAGKINESLMYLGQCLQMQSDSHAGGSKPALVPFRQCKLTELLFSNSFPSASITSHHGPSNHRAPQKAVMIVTADPLGDFNATSQILRYSALAREITVPRIPSVTSTIFSGTTANSKSQLPSGRNSPANITTEEIEFAAQEIARLSEELDVMNMRLTEEEKRRHEAENAWQAAEERCAQVEQEVREECAEAMDRTLEAERHRWLHTRAQEADHFDEHVDKKLDILTRSIQIHEDPVSSGPERVAELEDENDSLRRKLAQLERELNSRSPTKPKKTPFAPRPSEIIEIHDETDADIEAGLRNLNLRDSCDLPTLSEVIQQENQKRASATTTPGRKVRKLTTRKWDLAPEEEI